ncbi:hypothetical protein H5410_023204 [Solanum commersonii]|uniref:Uncharacterized protein n=1 Tax=Solanum commersonii TaxID=4109 RepID=A0A9J5ZG69_SOLCO|nr:hypothetical protein H5410_023204 [Solanum commersonii]
MKCSPQAKDSLDTNISTDFKKLGYQFSSQAFYSSTKLSTLYRHLYNRKSALNMFGGHGSSTVSVKEIWRSRGLTDFLIFHG